MKQGHQIEATTGHHLLCTLVHTKLDDAGRSQSTYFTTTDMGRQVKVRFDTNLSGQLDDIETCFSYVDMDARGVDREIGKIVRQFARSLNEHRKDRDRRVLNCIWYHVLGEFMLIAQTLVIDKLYAGQSEFGHDHGKISMNQFVNSALVHKFRLTGWSKTGYFPNPGSDLEKSAKISLAVVREVLEPWEKYLLASFEGKKTDDIPGTRFEFESWTDGSSLITMIW